MPSKRRQQPTFAELVERTPKAGAQPRDGQSRNRVVEGGGWDEQGRYWERAPSGDWLSREDVERHLADGALLLRHSYGNSASAWYSNADGREVWRDVLSERFAHDSGVSHFEDAGWPEQAVYSAELCTRPDGEQLIWFEEHC